MGTMKNLRFDIISTKEAEHENRMDLLPYLQWQDENKNQETTEARNLPVFCPKCKNTFNADIKTGFDVKLNIVLIYRGNMKTYTDLMEAYGKFQKDKTFRNLKNLYSKAFHTDGISAWNCIGF